MVKEPGHPQGRDLSLIYIKQQDSNYNAKDKACPCVFYCIFDRSYKAYRSFKCHWRAKIRFDLNKNMHADYLLKVGKKD